MENMEKSKSNCEKIWKISKKSRINCEMIWKIWKKSKLKYEMIWKIWKKGKSNSGKHMENMEENCEKRRKSGKKIGWIVKWYGIYGRKVGWIMKWYGK